MGFDWNTYRKYIALLIFERFMTIYRSILQGSVVIPANSVILTAVAGSWILTDISSNLSPIGQ